jgi:hypothetical protein
MTAALDITAAAALAKGNAFDWRLAISIAALGLSGAALALPYLRRPSLSLHRDAERTHSRVEGDRVPYLRLPVRNKKHRRSAKHARVVLDGYRAAGSQEPLTRLGSPFLGWPSVFGQESDAYVEVIFSSAERPLGLGRFARVKLDEHNRRVRQTLYRQDLSPAPIPEGPALILSAPESPEAEWHLHLELSDGYELSDERDWLSPGNWKVHLIVGADDGDAHTYEVDIAWKGDEHDSDAILAAALDGLKVRRR